MNDFKYLYYLTRIDGLGAVRIKRLVDKFGSAENVFEASINELAEVENISVKSADAILCATYSFPQLEADYNALLKKLDKLKIGVLTLHDEDYPLLLKKIYDPPVLLYYRGDYQKEKLVNCIGIVGTRKPTDYGKKIAEMFAAELSSIGITVVSGFARGIDTCAHRAVLANNAEGITAAVFGCGIDIIYPPENKKLYEEMIEKGLLISEYDVSAYPDSANFPKRNRIISGLSYGTLVIESGADGGALITARTALDQSREVFAVPGYITSKLSAGTNSLIKNGQAKLVENVNDILDEIQNKLINISVISSNGTIERETRVTLDLKDNEKLIYDSILGKSEPLHIDSISELTGLNISDSLVTLLNLEFKGCIEQLPGKRFKVR